MYVQDADSFRRKPRLYVSPRFAGAGFHGKLMNEDGEGNCFDVGDVHGLHPQLPIHSTNSIENVPMHLRISIRRAYLRERPD